MILRAAIIGILISAGALAQRFDVASIKPMNLSGEGSRRETIAVDPGSLTLRNVTLSTALQWAYGVKEYQIAGPAWIKDYRYEILAKPPQPSTEEQMRPMLQALLTERFKLTSHHETKDLTVYALTVAKSGLKMTPGDPNGKSVLQPDGATIVVKDTSVGDIVELLSRGSRGIPGDIPPVADTTGLTGRFNFSVSTGAFMQEVQAEFQKTAADPSVLIGAVQDVLEKQLGLHSDLRKVRTDILVIDHAESAPNGN